METSLNPPLNKPEMRKTPEHYLLQNNGASSLASNAMHLHPWFTLLLTQQSELGMQVHCIGGQRESSQCSVVV